MKLYDKMYGGLQCKFLNKTYKVQKIEGERVFIEVRFLDYSSWVLISQLEEFTAEEVKAFEDDDNQPREMYER